MRDGAQNLSEPIMKLINNSILSEKIPQTSKLTRVKPLFKKGSKLDVSNYRPVAILSNVSKILEKAIFLQLNDYLKNKILFMNSSQDLENHFPLRLA